MRRQYSELCIQPTNTRLMSSGELALRRTSFPRSRSMPRSSLIARLPLRAEDGHADQVPAPSAAVDGLPPAHLHFEAVLFKEPKRGHIVFGQLHLEVVKVELAERKTQQQAQHVRADSLAPVGRVGQPDLDLRTAVAPVDPLD